jgi:hypothetical protein
MYVSRSVRAQESQTQRTENVSSSLCFVELWTHSLHWQLSLRRQSERLHGHEKLGSCIDVPQPYVWTISR